MTGKDAHPSTTVAATLDLNQQEFVRESIVLNVADHSSRSDGEASQKSAIDRSKRTGAHRSRAVVRHRV